MSTAIAFLIMMATVLSGIGLVAQGSFTATADLSDAWKEMETRSGDIARTKMQILGATHSPPLVDITLKNSGQEPALDFTSWDIVIEYYETDGTYYQAWLPHTTDLSPGDNQWTVTGVYKDAGTLDPEVFQPGILNPGEEMIIRIKLSPAATDTPGNQVTVATSNGVSVSSAF